MARISGWALALGVAAVIGSVASAAAMSPCERDDPRRQPNRWSTSSWNPPAARHTLDLSAQSNRTRITVNPRSYGPGPNARRVCRATLVREHRPSGTVIVPRQQCWWQ